MTDLFMGIGIPVFMILVFLIYKAFQLIGYLLGGIVWAYELYKYERWKQTNVARVEEELKRISEIKV